MDFEQLYEGILESQVSENTIESLVDDFFVNLDAHIAGVEIEK